MELFKKLVRKSMHVLSEADDYASDYLSCDDRNLKEMYYNFANSHLDMYQKLKMNIVSLINHSDHNKENMEIIWTFEKDSSDEWYEKIKNKLSR